MNHRCLLTVVQLTCTCVFSASADIVEDQVLPLLGVHGHDTSLTNPWLPTPVANLSLALHNEDLLRRYVGRARVVDLSGLQSRVQATLRLPGAVPNWVRVEAAGASSDRTARSQDEDWAGSLDGTSTEAALAWRRDGATHMLSAGLRWGEERSRDQLLNLYTFHRSASNNRMNRFFWDLLAPTLGDEMVYDLSRQSLGADIGWSRRLGQYRVELQALWRRSTPDANIDHVNNGDREELRGPRTWEVSQEFLQRRLVVGLGRRVAAATIRLQAGYTSGSLYSLTQLLDVPESDSGVILDIVELGRANADQSGPDVTVFTAWEPSPTMQLRGTAILSHSTLEAHGVGNTPVLGYTLLALPISHTGTFSLKGRLTTWAAGLGARLHRKQFGWTLDGLALHSRYRGPTEADAQMEFGLFVAPVDQRTAYDLDLFRLSTTSWIRITSPLQLRGEMVQYAGDLQTHGVRPVPVPEGRGVTHRGGRIYTLSLYYLL